jgi:peptidoglycan/LPS O-acetylase OafA/YrhL
MSRAVSIAPQEPPVAGSGVGRRLLPVLFFGWMYGAVLLLLLGLLNQLAWMSIDDHQLTGWYYGAGLIVAFTVPVAGLVLARLSGHEQWERWFTAGVGLAFVALLLVGVAWSATSHPHFQEPAPVEREPAGPYQDCVAISGGTNTCPGG